MWRCTIRFPLVFSVSVAILFLALSGCETTQPEQPVPEAEAVTTLANELQETTAEQKKQEENTSAIVYATEEEKKEALFDIKEFIFRLNKIVQRKDFEAWYSYLSPDFIAYYSNPDVLAEISNQPTMKKYNIVLKSLKDYFLYVVYPSRQNDTVDEIEYIGYNKVKVYTYVNNIKLVLYVLEKIDGIWMISR